MLLSIDQISTLLLVELFQCLAIYIIFIFQVEIKLFFSKIRLWGDRIRDILALLEEKAHSELVRPSITTVGVAAVGAAGNVVHVNGKGGGRERASSSSSSSS